MHWLTPGRGGRVQGEATSLQFDWAWQAEGGGKRGAALDVNDLAAKRVLSPQTAEGIRQADPRTVHSGTRCSINVQKKVIKFS